MADRHDRGFALLIVLWWTVLLALLGTQLAGAGRLEVMRSGNVRDAAVADAAAEGALQTAAFHLLENGKDRWVADGAIHTMPLTGGSALIEISDEASKIGLNQATAGLLAALMSLLGEDHQQAAVIADAILDWRTSSAMPRSSTAKTAAYAETASNYAPPGGDFETLSELGLVKGMTPALLRRLTPYLTVYQMGDPDLANADPIVRAAWAQSGDIGSTETDRLGLQSEAKPVVIVNVRAVMASGARAAHRTVILLAEDGSHHPFQILDRDQ